MTSQNANTSKDFERALQVGRPPNIVRRFPNSRALIVSGKVIDRTMKTKGKAMTIAANGRNHFVIRGVPTTTLSPSPAGLWANDWGKCSTSTFAPRDETFGCPASIVGPRRTWKESGRWPISNSAWINAFWDSSPKHESLGRDL